MIPSLWTDRSEQTDPDRTAVRSVHTVYIYIVYSWRVCESNCDRANSFLLCLISQNRILISQNIVLNFKYLWYILRISQIRFCDIKITALLRYDNISKSTLWHHHNILAILWCTTKSNLSFETSQNGVNIKVDISIPKSNTYGALVMSLYS